MWENDRNGKYYFEMEKVTLGQPIYYLNQN